MTDSDCRWCGAALADAVRLPHRLRCGRCGVATTDPWPDAQALDAAYGDWYRPAAGRFGGPGDALLRRSRARLAVRIDKLSPPGPVLDVGSGDGTLVRALEARGRVAAGLERDTRAIGDVTDRQAAIVMWHSLEHLPEAPDVLARAAERLLPGGRLVIAVPNADSLQARVLGERWLALDVPRHLFHFTPAALARRLRELDLSIDEESHWRGGQVVFGWLHGLVRGADLYDAIRRPEARQAPLTATERRRAIAAACALAPVAVAAAATEVLARRGGTVMIEAVRSG